MFGLIARQRERVGILIASLIAAGALTVSTAPPPANAFFCIIQPGYKCLTVTFTLSGNGTGTLKTMTDGSLNTPDGMIDCDRAGGATTGTCSSTYLVANGTTLDIYWQALASSNGSVLFYFSGPSKHSVGGTLTVQWSTATSVTLPYYPVSFVLTSPIAVSVAATGSGQGSITSNPAGISCGSACSDEFASGQPLTLTAQPVSGSVFGGWSTGPCQGQGATCHFSPTSAANIIATFNPKPAATAAPKVTPKVTSGVGSPSPAASPSELVAAASAPAPSPSSPAEPLVAGGSPSDPTPMAIGAGMAALILAAGILILFALGRRRRRRARPQT